MANILKILRSITAGNRPAGRTYGEPYVNFADNQLGVFDSSNVARDLIGVPYFSTATSYAKGVTVNYQGLLYVSQVAVSPGAWNATQWSALISAASNLQPYAFNGGTIANNATNPNTTIDIDIWQGANSSNTSAFSIPAISKTTATWAAGSGNGGLGPGLTLTANAWYHVYAAIVAGVADAFFDTTFPPTHQPVGTTLVRRLNSIKLTGTNIRAFLTNGNMTQWQQVTALDYSVTNPAVSTLQPLTVPPGVRILAFGMMGVQNTTTTQISGGITISPNTTIPSTAQLTALGGYWFNMYNVAASVAFLEMPFQIETDTSGNIRYFLSNVPSGASIYGAAYGWFDQHGKYS